MKHFGLLIFAVMLASCGDPKVRDTQPSATQHSSIDLSGAPEFLRLPPDFVASRYSNTPAVNGQPSKGIALDVTGTTNKNISTSAAWVKTAYKDMTLLEESVSGTSFLIVYETTAERALMIQGTPLTQDRKSEGDEITEIRFLERDFLR